MGSIKEQLCRNVRLELAKEKAKGLIPAINKDTAIAAASAVGAVITGCVGGKILADKLIPILQEKNVAPEIFEINPIIEEKGITLGECQEYGRAFRNNLGDVYMCEDGSWTLQIPDSGILIDNDGRAYERVDDIPGAVPETYRFSHWTGDSYLDEKLQADVRTACYSTADGLGCEIRYLLVKAPTK
jgi:hypothetical protein